VKQHFSTDGAELLHHPISWLISRQDEGYARVLTSDHHQIQDALGKVEAF